MVVSLCMSLDASQMFDMLDFRYTVGDVLIYAPQNWSFTYTIIVILIQEYYFLKHTLVTFA